MTDRPTLTADRTIPCPSCGSWRFAATLQRDGDETWWYHACPDCGASGPDGDDRLTLATTPGYRELWAEIERLRAGCAP